MAAYDLGKIEESGFDSRWELIDLRKKFVIDYYRKEKRGDKRDSSHW